MNILDKLKRWSLTVIKDWQHATCGTQYYLKGKVLRRAYLYVLFTSEFQIVFLFRIYSGLYRFGLPIIPMFLYLGTKFLYKADLYPRAKVGPGMLLVHGFDVVVGGEVVIGDDVVIFNGVSIGKKYVGVISAGMPAIGNNCVLGAGAKILGAIKVGDSVTIGANSVVIKDIPSNSICAGNPAKLLRPREAIDE